MKWHHIVFTVLIVFMHYGGTKTIWGEEVLKNKRWLKDSAKMSDMPVWSSFESKKSAEEQNANLTPPIPTAGPISKVQLKYVGYFDALPVPVPINKMPTYPYNVVGRMVGQWHGSGAVYGNKRIILTAGHLLMNINTGHFYKANPVWYGQVNTHELFPDVQPVMGRRVVVQQYGLGYALVSFKQQNDFITVSKRVDIALMILYEDGAGGKAAPRIKGNESMQLLQSNQPKKSIGYISPIETYGYAISGDGEDPWVMREGKVTNQKFELGTWPYDYLAVMIARPRDFEQIKEESTMMPIGPGMSGSVVWSQDKQGQWQAVGVYVASTSKENVEDSLERATDTPILSVVYILNDEFETAMFKIAQEMLSKESM